MDPWIIIEANLLWIKNDFPHNGSQTIASTLFSPPYSQTCVPTGLFPPWTLKREVWKVVWMGPRCTLGVRFIKSCESAITWSVCAAALLMTNVGERKAQSCRGFQHTAFLVNMHKIPLNVWAANTVVNTEFQVVPLWIVFHLCLMLLTHWSWGNGGVYHPNLTILSLVSWRTESLIGLPRFQNTPLNIY